MASYRHRAILTNGGSDRTSPWRIRCTGAPAPIPSAQAQGATVDRSLSSSDIGRLFPELIAERIERVSRDHRQENTRRAGRPACGAAPRREWSPPGRQCDGQSFRSGASMDPRPDGGRVEVIAGGDGRATWSVNRHLPCYLFSLFQLRQRSTKRHSIFAGSEAHESARNACGAARPATTSPDLGDRSGAPATVANKQHQRCHRPPAHLPSSLIDREA
jgi:hypothetical protein